MTIRGEMAAYHLNRDDLDKALSLYLEIDSQRQLAGTHEPSEHTLLMPGVFHRKQKASERAADYLQREGSSLRHLAIAYLSMGQLGATFRHAWQSLLIYHRLGVLSRQRIVSMFRELLPWVVGLRQWRK